MSCHGTPGSSAMTGLTSTRTGAPEREVQRVFHSLKSDAQTANKAALEAGSPLPHPDPTREQTDEFLRKQDSLMRRDPELTDARKKTVGDNLNKALTAPTPDGPTFRVWQDIQAEAAVRLTKCGDCGQFSGRRTHVCQAGGLTKAEAKDKKKEAWRTEQDDVVKKAYADLDAGVQTLVTSEGWKNYLDTASRFHNYSLNNQILILIQKPDATRVASAKVWKELGREPVQGQKPIAVLAPITRKYVTEKMDEKTGEVEKTEHSRLGGFRGVPTYDISQTDGDDLPSSPTKLIEGEAPPGLQADLEAQITAEGFTISYEKIPGSANGYTTGDGSKRVVIDSDLSPAQRARTTMHELAHVKLGHLERTHEYHGGPGGCRGDMEVEAESVSYIVGHAKGLPAGDYSFGYVAGWAGGDPKKAKKNAERVLAGAKGILGGSWAKMESAQD